MRRIAELGSLGVMSRRVTIIVVAIGVVLAASLIVAVRSGTRRPPQQVMLIFLSYTNFGVPDPPRRVRYDRFAAFRLTNASPLRVSYFVESVDVWTAAGWQTNRLRATPTNWPHFGSGFGPGESSVFYVPPPTNSKWRIRLGFQEHAMGWRGYRDKFNDYLANRGRTVTMETFTGQRYELSSMEVSQ